MMPDRELLELAARATSADYEVDADGNIEILSEIGGCSGDWNPLTDDGDALRLAVKLGLSVGIDTCDDATRVSECDCELLAKHMHFDGGPEAATRRAIVRAAAMLAKEGSESNG